MRLVRGFAASTLRALSADVVPAPEIVDSSVGIGGLVRILAVTDGLAHVVLVERFRARAHFPGLIFCCDAGLLLGILTFPLCGLDPDPTA